MGKVSQSNVEATEEVLHITEAAFTDDAGERLIKSFKLWDSFRRILIPDSDGRVSLRPTMITARRRAVQHLIKSHTYEQTSRMLGIGIADVRNDVTAINDCLCKKKPQ